MRNLFIFAIIVLFCCVSCSSSSSSSSASSKSSTISRTAKSFRPCSDYPTIAGIDCSRFPKDSGSAFKSKKTYRVSPGKKDAISRALTNAQPGSVILVGGGRYEEGVDDEYRALVLDKKGIILRAEPGATVTVVPASSAVKNGVVVGASDVVIDGINLKGFSGAMVTLASRIRDVILENMVIEGACKDFCDGIVAPDEGGVSGVLVRNVTVNGADLSISCNVGPCSDWWLDGVRVAGSKAGDDTGADAIAAEVRDEDAARGRVSQNWLITNADVSGASGDGIDLKALRVAVYNSNIHDNQRNGIKMWRGGDIVNTSIVNHGADAAIVFDKKGTYRILNSLVAYENYGKDRSYTMTVGYDNPQDRINLSLINTVFFNNSSGVYFSKGTNAVVENCLFGNTDSDVLVVKGDMEIGESSSVSLLEKVAKASGNLPFKTDPLFRSPPRDFRFPSSSKLANGGAKVKAMPTFDAAGNSRVKGPAPDLGPLELH